jgi:hypothetical protein
MPKRLVIRAGYKITVFEILFSFSTKRRKKYLTYTNGEIPFWKIVKKNLFDSVDNKTSKCCLQDFI